MVYPARLTSGAGEGSRLTQRPRLDAPAQSIPLRNGALSIGCIYGVTCIPKRMVIRAPERVSMMGLNDKGFER